MSLSKKLTRIRDNAFRKTESKTQSINEEQSTENTPDMLIKRRLTELS